MSAATGEHVPEARRRGDRKRDAQAAGRRGRTHPVAAAGKPQPALDDALRATLAADLDAALARMRLALDETARRRLLDYVALIAKWNRVYNLTAIRDPREMLVGHVLDSLAIVAPLAARLKPAAPIVVDVGSGAGLPGMVLAIAWPHARLLLVEPVGKKAAFLRQCAGELGLSNVTVAEQRVQALTGLAADLVVCRAYASLQDFVESARALASEQAARATIYAAMKGARPDDEIAALPASWRVDEVLEIEVPSLAARRHLLLVHRVRAAESEC